MFLASETTNCRTFWVLMHWIVCNVKMLPQEDVVLCKIYRKAKTIRELKNQVEAMGEEGDCALGTLHPGDASSAPDASSRRAISLENPATIALMEGEKAAEAVSVPLRSEPAAITNQVFPPELETLVGSSRLELDWMGNSLLDQLLIPCVDYWSFYLSNVLNFSDDAVLSSQLPKDDVVLDPRILLEPNSKKEEDFVNL